MDIEYKKNLIKFEKVLNALDKLALDFTSTLSKLKIKYVLVSGYVSILFGRSRSSEDIDIFIEKINYNKFEQLWKELNKKFECLTSTNSKSAYKDYLKDTQAIRFSYKGKYIPNMEVRFTKIEIETWALKNKKKVIVNNKKLYVSPIELQISYKLFLGNEKDIEDAKHLYRVFKNKVNKGILHEFNRKLKIGEVFNKYLE